MNNKTYTAPAVSVVMTAGHGFMENVQTWGVYDENRNKIGGGRVKEQGEEDDFELDSKQTGWDLWEEEEELWP